MIKPKAGTVLFLSICIGIAAAARPTHRLQGRTAVIARRHAAIRWALTAVGDSSGDSLQPTRKQAILEQREFCLSDRGLFLDSEANFVRYPVNFDGFAFSMFCYGRHDLVSNGIFQAGSWEEDTSKSMLAAMHQACLQLNIPLDKAIFLDIGANIGWYTLLFAAAGHSVISFEPMHANEQLLRRSLCNNAGFQEGVTYYNSMLSNAPHKNCTLFSDIDNSGDGIVTCDQQFLPPENYTVQDAGLQMTTLDTALAELYDPIVMVKLDVEGHEDHVFKGAERTIIEARVPYLMFEFGYTWIERSGGHPQALLARLVGAGYQFSFESFQGTTFDPLVYYSDPLVQQDMIRNVFCVHERMLH